MPSKEARKDSFTGMNARDYQHKRFRSRGADNSSPANGQPLGTSESALSSRIVTPPRRPNNSRSANKKKMMQRAMDLASKKGEDGVMEETMRAPVSPNKAVVDDEDAAYVHKPTAKDGGLTTTVPAVPTEPIRYSLNKESRRSPDASAGNKLKNSHSLAKSRAAATSEPKLSPSKIRKQDPHAYKIFLLLLQPQSKIFELIQLIYNPNDTTIGSILEMIPENATEAALGAQQYIGLCRPKTQEELLDTELLASETQQGVVSANITLGEILVAIPQGFTGKDVSALSKQILANPKIVKLLKRADPLAPKKKRSRHRSSNHHHGGSVSSRRSSSRENVHVLEKHDEAEEDDQKMKQAMEHAVAEAAAANAAIPGGGVDIARGVSRSNSITSERSMDLSTQESIDESYSSWSKSFDASFSAASICSGASRRQLRRRDRQARRIRILKQSCVGALGIMIAFYALDTNQPNVQHSAVNDTVSKTPMGFMGIFQCFFLLLTLYKVERWFRMTNNPDYSPNQGNCPFLKASSRALERFKSRYAKKLKKKPAAKTASIGDDDSLSQRLRRFSLKAAANGSDTDTGSI